MTVATSSRQNNPLLQPWEAPHGLPPFDTARPEHFAEAFEVALTEQRAEIDAIGAQLAAPSFDNTLAAFDRSGRLLARLEGLFHNLTSSETSPALQAVERQLAPRMAAHGNAIYMHAALFQRIDTLHAQRGSLGLTAEQRRLLERVHLEFVRAGAKLQGAARERYGAVMERLAELTTQFGQNVLADESAFRLELRGERDLAGLPEFVRAAARQAGADRGIDAAVITLSRSHIVPFLTFSERRDLREQAWRAWVSRGEHDGAHDNRPVAREILQLRAEQARLHGHASYADYALGDTMAGSQAAVNRLLQQVWVPAKARVAEEREALKALLLTLPQSQRPAAGESQEIEAWDWRCYAEKVRQARYDLDEAAVKPYFPLDRMVEAAFDCAQRLFGLRFKVRDDIRAYHPDVKVYEVSGSDGALVGIFLHDNFARPSKRSGAWMGSYRQQTRNVIGGGDVLPIVVNNNNFAKGSPGAPTLLSFDDAATLFHEFGHGLHGLLSSVTYERLSGTNVLRDFVELPSQIFEHWLAEPEVLKRHARHVETGEPIPDALVERLQAARKFNQGYETVRYTASALVDMAVHAVGDPEGIDIVAFEAAELERIGLPHGVGLNHRLPHFQHLFSSASYAAGYYVYLWAEVLDADGYDAFTEAGNPFDAAVAKRLREHVYSVGNSREPGETYRAFRGRDASVEPMLRERGLLTGG
ncbi:M3 family metallopeptidase [Rhizobacter sp. OV335]|uniref:M3 family metallopeptidase n=1 Tax=Rhizobacter sp. OV335 TaxID=1500264 RepID=UPI000918FE1C|nr:M3 family metallopeptidase [Rhizobacter sp. OV335]SHN35929.1 peptidyl-dipeptidase Dcp [Rhizobacter sp. OV335]